VDAIFKEDPDKAEICYIIKQKIAVAAVQSIQAILMQQINQPKPSETRKTRD
jgi:hypothetical protein